MQLFKYKARQWHYFCLMALITSLVVIALQFLFSPQDAYAAACGGGPGGRCFRGRVVTVGNYGSGATIGSTNPVTNGHVSFEFIQTRRNDRFIQTGWSKQEAITGNVAQIFWESYVPDPARCNGGYCNGFVFVAGGISGDIGYSNQFNGTNWCHGFAGANVGGNPCFSSETGTSVTINSANPGTEVAFYGETDDTVAQMGDRAPFATYLSAIKYQQGPTTPANQWIFIQQQGAIYNNGQCGFNPCPYGLETGFAAGNVWIKNYTCVAGQPCNSF